MRLKGAYITLLLLVCSAVVLTQCRKERFVTDKDARLDFSTDTLTFDTVFTQVGSITRWFKVYNRFNRTMKIKSIQLEGGDNSQFRINIDGISTSSATDLEILPRDSMYVFVEVTVDPNNINLPFVITDRVFFETSEKNVQQMVLEAWGQNANYIVGDTLACDEVWNDQLPYVIYGYAYVPPNCKLTIEKNTKVYFHGPAGLFVHGTLRVNGAKEEEVIFQQDRLEAFFEELPGQWQAIHLLRGSGKDTNRIDYAIVKNSDLGITFGQILSTDTAIVFDPVPSIVSNTKIINTRNSALFGFFGNFYAFNCLIYNTGTNAVQLVLGGVYRFDHCTIVNLGSSFLEHEDAVLGISNQFDGIGEADILANFNNCIFYGSLDEEVILDNNPAAAFDVVFDHCLLKTEDPATDTTRFKSIILNQNPNFLDSGDDDYHLSPTSPCINTGFDITGGQFDYADLDGALRDDQPDIGCYEAEE